MESVDLIDQLISDLKNASFQKKGNDSNKLWIRVQKVLTHDDWYSEEQMELVRQQAQLSKGLTYNQKFVIQKFAPKNKYDDWDHYCLCDGSIIQKIAPQRKYGDFYHYCLYDGPNDIDQLR